MLISSGTGVYMTAGCNVLVRNKSDESLQPAVFTGFEDGKYKCRLDDGTVVLFKECLLPYREYLRNQK